MRRLLDKIRHSRTADAAMVSIAEEMAAWMDAHGVRTLDEIRGCAR